MKQRMEKAKTIRFLYKAYSMRQGYNKCNIHRNNKKKVRAILTKKCSKNTKLVSAVSAVSANGMCTYGI